MLSYTEIEKGTTILLNGDPHEVLETTFVRMQQRKPVVQAKIKNLINGKVTPHTFQQSDSIEEAEVKKEPAIFIYTHRETYVFAKHNDSGNRFSIPEETLEEQKRFLKEGLPVTLLVFDGNIIGINLPIKVDYEVVQAPPAIKGDTATGGTKTVTLENGLEVSVPMFIKEGDVVRINTETGEYTERVEKK